MRRATPLLAPAVAVLILCAARPGSAARQAPVGDRIVITRVLAVPPVGRGGRQPVAVDAIQSAIVSGQWRAPSAGDTITTADGDVRRWSELTAQGSGRIEGPALMGGYAYASVHSDRDEVRLLEASGHSMVYVNGEPRAGDVYSAGYVKLPVALRRGRNDFLFSVARGGFSAALAAMPSPVRLSTEDPTLPDMVAGERIDSLGAVVVINGLRTALRGAVLQVSGAGLRTTSMPVPPVPALGIRKVPIRIVGQAPSKPGRTAATLRLRSKGVADATAALSIEVAAPTAARRLTFVSEIDGSVQYYAVVPPTSRPRRAGADRQSGDRAPALVLSLHGASVEAIGQARSYASKPWAVIVSPTNRRPYGFDWEDWGRLDAQEVLANASREFGTDPRRTYLTGHSMGGHGTWHIGVNRPDLFAAIAPSAGWVSFQSYGGGARFGQETPVQDLFRRAGGASDTLSLTANLRTRGVYVLHGDADDNVPVSEARAMRSRMSDLGMQFSYYERPGAGHWWGAESDPGAGCVDWPGIFDLFASRRLPSDAEVRLVEYTTPNPSVLSRVHWLTVEQQSKPLAMSRVSIRSDSAVARFVGTTENVARMTIDLGHVAPAEKVRIEIDGTKTDLAWPTREGSLSLARTTRGWEPSPPLDATHKTPRRGGPFKMAFGARFVLVAGTAGSADENAWAAAKARYDAESFYYRGNGAVDVVTDADFAPGAFADRSVILYGRSDTNRAWSKLLGHCPVTVTAGSIKLGDRQMTGDLACLFAYPRSDSPTAYVGVVGGTSLTAMRITDRMPYLSPGTAYPDLVVLSPEALTKGISGVAAAGYFGSDWSVASGDFAWTR